VVSRKLTDFGAHLLPLFGGKREQCTDLVEGESAFARSADEG